MMPAAWRCVGCVAHATCHMWLSVGLGQSRGLLGAQARATRLFGLLLGVGCQRSALCPALQVAQRACCWPVPQLHAGRFL